jgi:hypothetical protein
MMELPRAPMRRGPEVQKVRTPRSDVARARRPSTCGANLAAGSLHFNSSGRSVSQMHIWLDDPTLVDDLCAHYRRSGFAAERVGGGRVEVALADAPSREQERLEVLLHLRVWEAVNPDARGELLP